MFKTLERRLTGYYLLVLALVLAGYGLGAYWLVRVTTLNGLDHANGRMLAPVLHAFERDHEDFEEVTHELAEVAISDREHLALLTRKGRVIYARGMQLDPEPTLHPGAFSTGGHAPMRVRIEPLLREGEVVGYLRVGQSMVGPERALRNLALGLALAAPLALVVASLGGAWLAGRAMKPVAEALERERRFTRDASHELRTPLSVLLSHAQLALGDPQVTGPVREKLLVIERTARSMTSLVGDLLTLGRADVGMQGASVDFSLEELVDDEVSAMQPLALRQGVSLVFLTQVGRSMVQGDPSRIAQAVRNLLDNALRYAQASERIEVILAERRGGLVVTVSDSGPGIPPEKHEAIFERFVRLDHGRDVNPEGSGLGLAISRAVARAHGGDLTLDSQPGRTAFSLWLPLA